MANLLLLWRFWWGFCDVFLREFGLLEMRLLGGLGFLG